MSNDDFHTHDSDQIVATLCGIPIDGGYAEGTFLEVESTTPSFTTKAGTDGSVTRSKQKDKRGKIRLTLMCTSAANSLLSTMLNLDEVTANGAGVAPSLIKDLNGTALYSAEKSWITGPPQVTYSNEAEARVWEIECAKLIRFDGN